MPRDSNWSELLSFLMRENLPGGYPYTAGVFPYHHEGEDPIRMFAGEGTPERTSLRPASMREWRSLDECPARRPADQGP